MENCILLVSLLAILLSAECSLKIKPNFLRNSKNVKDYLAKEILQFGRQVLYFQNDFNQPIETRLSIPNETILSTNEDIKKTVTFRLYTPEIKDNYEALKINDSDILAKSHFNQKRPTRFITHGYLNSADGPSCTLIRDAYLKTNCNVIVIDWSPLSGGSYVRARLYVEPIGEYVSSMINFLENNGMNANMTTLVGHSLGAHIVGLAGQDARQKVNYTIGLDPALPLFELIGSDQRISSDDAKFVEIIHTNAGFLGQSKRLGKFDFYPNGGAFQPGCSKNLEGASCSHARSYEYFAESLQISSTPFYSLKCDSYEDFKSSKCENFNSVMGGIDNFPQYNGSYFLATNLSAPFSLGKVYEKPNCSGGIFSFILKLINYFISSGYSC